MTAVLAPPPSWTTLTLDTTPPTVTLEADSRIEPPDPLVVVVRSGEPLGPVSITLVDALGRAWPLGHALLDDRTATAVVQSTEFASGPARITVRVADQTCNSVTLVREVFFDRPRVFDVALTLTGAFDVVTNPDGAFEVEAGVTPSIGVDLTLVEPFDSVGGITHAHDVEMEVTDDG